MNLSTWILNNAPGFRALSGAERSAIRDFALLWSIFEGRYIDGGEANFASIQASCLRAIGPDEIGAGLFSRQLSYFRTRYDGVDAQFRLDALMNGHTPGTRRYIIDTLNGRHDRRHQIASGLVMIAYRLRNNLFHGTKWNDLMVDQMRNFRAGGHVLVHLMGHEPHRLAIG